MSWLWAVVALSSLGAETLTEGLAWGVAMEQDVGMRVTWKELLNGHRGKFRHQDGKQDNTVPDHSPQLVGWCRPQMPPIMTRLCKFVLDLIVPFLLLRAVRYFLVASTLVD